MISGSDLRARVDEWDLREDVVEKDYVLGWVLGGIGTEPALRDGWVFKGGTCLKKCYLETFRFSEDLDFTVLPGGPVESQTVVDHLGLMLRRIGQESGIEFAIREPRIRVRPNGSLEARIYYRGPRQTPSPASVRLDLTRDEVAGGIASGGRRRRADMDSDPCQVGMANGHGTGTDPVRRSESALCESPISGVQTHDPPILVASVTRREPAALRHQGRDRRVARLPRRPDRIG